MAEMGGAEGWAGPFPEVFSWTSSSGTSPLKDGGSWPVAPGPKIARES